MDEEIELEKLFFDHVNDPLCALSLVQVSDVLEGSRWQQSYTPTALKVWTEAQIRVALRKLNMTLAQSGVNLDP